MKAVVVLLRKLSGPGLNLDLCIQRFHCLSPEPDLEPIMTTQELPTTSLEVLCLLLPCVLCVVCVGS